MKWQGIFLTTAFTFVETNYSQRNVPYTLLPLFQG